MTQSRPSTLNQVMGNLKSRQTEISHFLPRDIPYEKFMATIEQALTQHPEILDCTPKSILTACMKAAYDGLRIDGREAAIVKREIKGKGKSQGQVFKVANYMPMTFGLVQQIYRGKEVAKMEVEAVYEGDEFVYQKGTNPGIHHIPNLERAVNAPVIASYSIATLVNGHQTFEVCTKADIAQIRSSATTDYVWNKWPGEMAKKSAVRRHRKMLPLGERDHPMRDAEQEDLYNVDAPALPTGNQQGAIPARPSRRRALEDNSKQAGDLDLSSDGDAVTIEGNSDQRLTSSTSDEVANLKPAEKPEPESKETADFAEGGSHSRSTSNEGEKINKGAQDDDFDARLDAAIQEAGDEQGS